MTDDCCDDKRKQAEKRKRIRRFLKTAVDCRDILSYIDPLLRVAGKRLDGFGRHHDARTRTVLVQLRKDLYFLIIKIPVLYFIEDEGFDAERCTRKVQKPSLVIEDIEEKAIVRTLVEELIIRHSTGMLIDIGLRFFNIFCRIDELARLLRGDCPLHRFMYADDKHGEKSNHNARIDDGKLPPAGTKKICCHLILPPLACNRRRVPS